MVYKVALLFHLLGLGVYLGAGLVQHWVSHISGADGLAPAAREAYERLAATLARSFELPALLVSVLSGIALLQQRSFFLKMGWMHAKLTGVLVLLVIAHLEMFNARKIVRARGAAAPDEPEIARRKRRQDAFLALEAVAFAVVMVMVIFVRPTSGT